MKGDRFWKNAAGQDAMSQAETCGLVADNIEYRKALMVRVDGGEITLEQAQAELKRVKASAKRNGQLTRSQAFNEGYRGFRR